MAVVTLTCIYNILYKGIHFFILYYRYCN